MLVHPQLNPIALDLGILQVHWYGLTYLAAFGLFHFLATRRIRQAPFVAGGWQPRDVEDLLFFGVVGVILGGRLGYVLFYKPMHYLQNPLEVLAVWKGGMAFHGGLLGVLVAMALFAHLRGRRFFEVTDLIAPCVPTGLAMGRVGNFINGELWGRAADASLPWAMVFPQSGSDLPRHPSQVYQFLLEGLSLFVILWCYGRSRGAHHRADGAVVWGRVSGLFMIGYGAFRFIAEYFREPDSFLGLLTFNLSMGQWLCVPMIAAGALIWASAGRRAA
ncbi:phosphatidylglycerol:prolipoprotein diacylglycerol transferase [Sphaerotilus hippei]|uniref:Phosphatidylglycerol--prolipoprotein diacylglyceryl transferase n=1 Tax=Sphaerotilus hippei TaxID=744406 RepID=A0A318GZA0_9BURK|nr:prolipoprotein diacylglyceryl transferase [Sphaerotilus hippei]PXW95542.1 phosphatidylglycerol:prolipoprotein diacylglycerol transferase [Sphaerotilus hippei]